MMRKYFIFKWIASIAIFMTFVLASWNCISINRKTSQAFASVKLEVDSSLMVDPPVAAEYDADRRVFYHKLFDELEHLKKGVFDANTLTFLVCFTLALLFTLLLTLQDRLIKQNDIVSNARYQMNLTKNIQQYYTRLHCIYCGGILVNYILFRENFIIQAHILNTIYTMNRETLSLMREIPENNQFISRKFSISDTDRKAFVRVIRDTIHLLELEEVRRNPDNTTSKQSMEDLAENLEELEARINNIPRLSE